MDGRTPLDQNLYIANFVDNITKTWGGHIFKAGVFVNVSQRGAQTPVTFNGAFDFGTNANNPLDTGYAFGNAVLGVFNSYTEALSRPYEKVNINDVEWFLQDNWKVSKKLTIHVGLRFTLIEPMYEINGQASSFVPSLYDPKQAVHLIQLYAGRGQAGGRTGYWCDLPVPADRCNCAGLRNLVRWPGRSSAKQVLYRAASPIVLAWRLVHVSALRGILSAMERPRCAAALECLTTCRISNGCGCLRPRRQWS